MQNVPILNDHVDMRPILNGNLSIHSIHLKPKKDPFPSKLCSHIPSRMDPSQTPGRQKHISLFCVGFALVNVRFTLDNINNF